MAEAHHPRANYISAWRRRGGVVQDIALITVSAFFALIHLQRLADGNYSSIFFALDQAFLVVMFLTRRRSQQTSTRPIDWVVASIGGWLPLAYRPVDGSAGLADAGIAIQICGLGLTLIGFAYLGKSFGVVAANRGIKVNGPYRLVRHPIYFSHFITGTGFLLANASFLNAALYAIVAVAQVLRIRAEERVLSESAEYQQYQRQVRWRLVPGLY